MNTIDLRIFAERLLKRRTELGLTQEALAERANINQSTVSQLERGEQTPTLNSVIMLTRALDISVDWLLGITDVRQRSDDLHNLNEEETQLLDTFRSVDRSHRTRLIEIISAIVEFKCH